jgi:hypothetical protein
VGLQRITACAALLLSAAATAQTPAAQPVTAGAATTATAERSADEAAALAARFQAELQARLQAALADGGPVHAVTVCREEAPAIASRLANESGWQLRRVGTRVRNPATGVPDTWEQAQLSEFARRMGAGEDAARLRVAVVADEPGGSVLRYMQPIVTAPACLACHGDRAAQSPALREALGRHYPQDQATGYAAGELRGAFSLRKPLH